MTDKEKFIVYMSLCDLPTKKQELFLNTLEDFSMQNISTNHFITQNLSTEEYHRFVTNFDLRELDNAISNMRVAGIEIITIEDERYPSKLLNLPERPLILYAMGDLSLLNKKSIAVVGTRSPTNYGKIVTEKFVGSLATAGFVIISGLCYGVDEIAHKKTLAVGGKTIAVVGSGFNNIYPAINTNLAKEIAENGLLLSEYPPSFQAKRYTFPRRNRIVAGLCDGVLIPEAGFKSGTVHTKDFALDYGKDIFAVAGSIFNEKSNLPNELIKTAQAECVLSPDDIIEYYGMNKIDKKKVTSVTFDEQTILNLLEDGEKDMEYLAEKSNIPVNILSSCLTTLEIRGLIRRLPAKTFALI